MQYSVGGADSRTNSAGVLGGSLGVETGLSGHLRFKVMLREHAVTFIFARVTTTT